MLILDSADIEKLTRDALTAVDSRSAQILRERYGLASAEPKTLAEIGESYELTRERVRQIEEKALEAAREKIALDEKAKKLTEALNDYLDSVGHVRRADSLAQDLIWLWKVSRPQALFLNSLYFLAEVLETPVIVYSANDFHDVWHNDEASFSKAKKLVAYLNKKEESDFDGFLSFAKQKFDLEASLVLNYLSISKNFGVGPYGDFGPRHWSSVNPKTVRDRAHLVLEKIGRPLHFSEIATEVNKIGGAYRSPATVHNELIKDPRFVLIRRGVYDLNS